jgi:hypothetical protein
LEEVKVTTMSVICYEEGIFRIGTREVMAHNGTRMESGERTDKKDAVAFMVEIKGESNPEIAGSLNGKKGILRIANGKDV